MICVCDDRQGEQTALKRVCIRASCNIQDETNDWVQQCTAQKIRVSEFLGFRVFAQKNSPAAGEDCG